MPRTNKRIILGAEEEDICQRYISHHAIDVTVALLAGAMKQDNSTHPLPYLARHALTISQPIVRRPLFSCYRIQIELLSGRWDVVDPALFISFVISFQTLFHAYPRQACCFCLSQEELIHPVSPRKSDSHSVLFCCCFPR